MISPDSPRSRRRPLAALVCAALLGASAGGARAQERFVLENLDPAPDRDGGIVAVHGARPLTAGEFGITAALSYGRAPLTLKSGDSGSSLGELVGSVGTLSLLGAVGIARRFDVGVGLPLHRMSKGSDFALSPGPGVNAALLDSSQVGLGDLRIVPRLGLITRERDEGLGLALLAAVWLPTGDDDIYAGENVRVEPRLALDLARGGLHGALNIGYMVRSEARLLNSTVDDMLRIGLGVEVPFGASPLSGLIELNSQLNVLDSDFGSEDAPTEGLLGLRLRSKSGVQLDLAGGPGIVRGVGSPSYRLFAALGFVRHETPVRDRDGDGVLDGADRCPDRPEDADGFQDQDGCPDLDNDQDGIADASDGCLDEPEDKDGFEDDDGCPDADNDRDGVLDSVDRCPTVAEDVDQYQDADGCPDEDNDNDTVLDIADACPEQPGLPENRGCPAAPPAATPEPLVVVKDDLVEIRDTIHFAVNQAIIEDSSAALLDAIAATLKAHAEIELLRVEGHTDDTGKRFRNQQLSEQRAQAVVDALVARGIAKRRLTARGLGPSQPLVPNDSEENRAKNRRTELHIEKRSEKAAPPAPVAQPPAAAPPVAP